MKVKIIMGLIMLVIIIVLSIVLPIVLLKKKNDPPVELLKQLNTPVELLKQLDTPIVAANQALPETAYTGYIQDAADGQYLIFQIGQPITKTKIKLEATIMTAIKLSANAVSAHAEEPWYLFFGQVNTEEIKAFFFQERFSQSLLSSIPTWNLNTQTLSTVAETGWDGAILIFPDLINALLINVRAVENNKVVSTLSKNMTFEEVSLEENPIFSSCTTCIRTLQVVG